VSHYTLKRNGGGAMWPCSLSASQGAHSSGEILAGAAAAPSKCALQRLQPVTHSLQTHRGHQVKRAARLTDPIPQLTGIVR
jgi:hypothetical protein